jgi:Flp pilus assembly pilin Flp
MKKGVLYALLYATIAWVMVTLVMITGCDLLGFWAFDSNDITG